MPYILKKDRKRIDKEHNIKSFGELNYIIYKEMVKQWKAKPKYSTIHGIKYWSNNSNGLYWRMRKLIKGLCITDIVIAGELAFMEFYRRYGVPYENKAKKRNGDVK